MSSESSHSSAGSICCEDNETSNSGDDCWDSLEDDDNDSLAGVDNDSLELDDNSAAVMSQDSGMS